MASIKEEYKGLRQLIQINQPLHVIIQGKQKKFVYKSAVGDFDSGSIHIMPIMRQGGVGELKVGEKVELVYFRNDASYEFQSRVIGHREENNITLTILNLPNKCIRVQRREFFRLKVTSEATYAPAILNEESGLYIEAPGAKYRCYLEDISGGGICLRSLEPLHELAHIQIEFLLPPEEKRDIAVKEIVKIVRTKKVRPLNEPNKLEYTYGGQFVGISEKVQQAIIRFIMRKQIEERQIEK